MTRARGSGRSRMTSCRPHRRVSKKQIRGCRMKDHEGMPAEVFGTAVRLHVRRDRHVGKKLRIETALKCVPRAEYVWRRVFLTPRMLRASDRDPSAEIGCSSGDPRLLSHCLIKQIVSRTKNDNQRVPSAASLPLPHRIAPGSHCLRRYSKAPPADSPNDVARRRHHVSRSAPLGAHTPAEIRASRRYHHPGPSADQNRYGQPPPPHPQPAKRDQRQCLLRRASPLDRGRWRRRRRSRR